MDRERFSQIAHTGLRFWNPVDPAVLEAWIDRLPLSASSLVLDVGCGRGEFLLRVGEVHGCGVVGVEKSRASVEHAQAEARRRISVSGADFRCTSFDAGAFESDSFDLAVCIGSSQAMGDLSEAMGVLVDLTRPGGLILIGEGYWRREPPEQYLSFLGCDADALLTHAGNESLAGSLGLEVVESHETSDRAWSAYEDTYAANIHRHLGSNPDDPDADPMRDRIERWRDAYLRWGRETLGFGLYLIRKPDRNV